MRNIVKKNKNNNQIKSEASVYMENKKCLVGILFRLFRRLLSYLILLFFLPHLTSWLLCLWKAAREFKEGRKETKIPFKFQLYFRVLMTILWRGKFSWTRRNMTRFPDKVLKCICHSRWSVVTSSLCFSIETTATSDATCPKSDIVWTRALPASSQVKEGPFRTMMKAYVSTDSCLVSVILYFRHVQISIPVRSFR